MLFIEGNDGFFVRFVSVGHAVSISELWFTSKPGILCISLFVEGRGREFFMKISAQIPCLKNRIYAILDTETTGTSPAYDQIIEIGIIRVEDGRITKKLKTLIRPSARLPSFITSITGISESDLVDAPVIRRSPPSTSAICSKARSSSRTNARFDYAFVKNEFKRIGVSWNAKTLCHRAAFARALPAVFAPQPRRDHRALRHPVQGAPPRL